MNDLIYHLKQTGIDAKRVTSDFHAARVGDVFLTLRREQKGAAWEASVCVLGHPEWTDFEEVQTTDDVWCLVRDIGA